MARLLVSVRSAAEARAALAGGADLIDVKEPARGPLGRADARVWREVRAAVPADVPVSVALGELTEWLAAPPPRPDEFLGLSFRKLGLAGADARALRELPEVRRQPGPPWIAVAYSDWHAAAAPDPDAVLEAAIRDGCAGVLVDTWRKTVACPPDDTWRPWIASARRAGLIVAVAGGLDEHAIAARAGWEPDYFAVRGAACGGGDRVGSVDPARVARLAAAARGSRV